RETVRHEVIRAGVDTGRDREETLPMGSEIGRVGENGRSRGASNLDLPTKLDDPVRRDAEELGCIERQVRQKDKQPVAPAKHGGAPWSWPQFLAADEERGLHQIDMEVLDPALCQGAHDVRLVHE